MNAQRRHRLRGSNRRCPRAGTARKRSLRLEKERIFCREWLCVARAEELPEPGAYRVLDVLGESILCCAIASGAARLLQRLPPPRLAAVPRERRAGRPRTGAAAAVSAAVASPAPTTSGPTILTAGSSRRPHLTSEPGFDKRSFSLYPVALDVLGRLRVPASDARPRRCRSAQQLGAIPERISRYPLARAAHRPHDPLRGRRQLEGDLRELQRVLPLRRRASGAVRGGAGVPRRAAARTWTGRAAFRTVPARTPSQAPARRAGAPSRASTRTSACATRASWCTRTCS